MTIKNTYGEKFNVIPSTYKENENKYKLNSVFAAGMCYYFFGMVKRSRHCRGHNRGRY